MTNKKKIIGLNSQEKRGYCQRVDRKETKIKEADISSGTSAQTSSVVKKKEHYFLK